MKFAVDAMSIFSPTAWLTYQSYFEMSINFAQTYRARNAT